MCTLSICRPTNQTKYFQGVAQQGQRVVTSPSPFSAGLKAQRDFRVLQIVILAPRKRSSAPAIRATQQPQGAESCARKKTRRVFPMFRLIIPFAP